MQRCTDWSTGKSNQQNLGVITHGGANTAFVQTSSPEETGVIHSATLILPSYVAKGHFNWGALHTAVRCLTLNLNLLIDSTTYLTPHSRKGDERQRAIAIGVRGLAEVFITLGVSFDSQEAKSINYRLFHTIYNGSLDGSCTYAEHHGCCASFANSPLAHNRLQYDIWDRTQDNRFFDWNALRDRIAAHGVANSLFVGLSPATDTSRVTGFTHDVRPLVR